jgi:hypothetical protein
MTAIVHVAHQHFAAHHTTAAALFDKGSGRLYMQLKGECASELLGAFGAPDVRRNDRYTLVAKQRGEMIDKQRDGFEIGRGTAKRVLESSKVVDVEGDHPVHSARLEEPRHVLCRDRITRLRAPVLARIAKVGHHGGDALGTGVLQSPDEKQQAAELIIWALLGVPVERVDDKDIPPAHLGERAYFVLAVFERALFVFGEH